MARKLLDTIVGTAATVKVYRDTDYNEFVVVTLDSPRGDYFTDDKVEAYQTARVIAGEPDNA